MLETRDEWIKKRAYALWEEEGHPDGRDTAHWEQASSERTALEESVVHEIEGPVGKKAKSKRKSDAAAAGDIMLKAVAKRGSKKAAEARA